MKIWHGLISATFGFYLAGSSFASRHPHHSHRDLPRHQWRRMTSPPNLQEVITTTDSYAVLRGEIRRLRARLTRALNDLHNLITAARATLAAQREGEDDPLYYIRDELRAQGQLPDDYPDQP
jgi:hypothetical protein